MGEASYCQHYSDVVHYISPPAQQQSVIQDKAYDILKV